MRQIVVHPDGFEMVETNDLDWHVMNALTMQFDIREFYKKAGNMRRKGFYGIKANEISPFVKALKRYGFPVCDLRPPTDFPRIDVVAHNTTTLRKARIREGIPQTRMARAIGISQADFSRCETMTSGYRFTEEQLLLLGQMLLGPDPFQP